MSNNNKICHPHHAMAYNTDDFLITSMFPQVVKAVKMRRNPTPRNTTFKVLGSAMVSDLSLCPN